jgi:hypothetical protein
MPHEDRGILGGLIDRVIGPPARVKEAHRQQRAQAAALKPALTPFGAEAGAQLGGLLTSGIPAAQSLGAQQLADLQARQSQGVSFADTRQLTRQQQQRDALQAAQDAVQRQVDLDQSRLDLARSGFDFDQARKAALQPAQIKPETALQFNSLKGALDSIDTMIKIREDIGSIGPIDFINHPEAAAQVKNFQSFESVNLFKELANDERLSDEDRNFYSSIVERGVFDVLLTGGQVELAQLRGLQERLLTTQLTLLGLNPGAQQQFPHLFTRKSFADIGTPFRAPATGRESAEQVFQSPAFQGPGIF